MTPFVEGSSKWPPVRNAGSAPADHHDMAGGRHDPPSSRDEPIGKDTHQHDTEETGSRSHRRGPCWLVTDCFVVTIGSTLLLKVFRRWSTDDVSFDETKRRRHHKSPRCVDQAFESLWQSGSRQAGHLMRSMALPPISAHSSPCTMRRDAVVLVSCGSSGTNAAKERARRSRSLDHALPTSRRTGNAMAPEAAVHAG
jgi:hypothetical protein